MRDLGTVVWVSLMGLAAVRWGLVLLRTKGKPPEWEPTGRPLVFRLGRDGYRRALAVLVAATGAMFVVSIWLLIERPHP